MPGLDDYAKKKTKELEAKLARTIFLVQAAVFVAVAAVGLAIGYFALESMTEIEIGLVLVLAVVAAIAVGSRLWRIYREIKQDAVNFVEDYKRKFFATTK